MRDRSLTVDELRKIVFATEPLAVAPAIPAVRRDLREALGVSRRLVAEACGLSEPTIVRVENPYHGRRSRRVVTHPLYLRLLAAAVAFLQESDPELATLFGYPKEPSVRVA